MMFQSINNFSNAEVWPRDSVQQGSLVGWLVHPPSSHHQGHALAGKEAIETQQVRGLGWQSRCSNTIIR